MILFSLCRSLSPVKFIHFQFNVKVLKFYKFNFTCRKIAAALKTQIDKLWHTTTNYHSEPMFEYAEKLTSKFPPHLNVCFFTNSGKIFKGTEFRKYIFILGSEANDLAFMLARLHTGRFDVIALRNAYHGATQSVQGATNLGTWKQPLPAGFGTIKVKSPNPFGGHWGGKHCRWGTSEGTGKARYTRDCNCQPSKADKVMLI